MPLGWSPDTSNIDAIATFKPGPGPDIATPPEGTS